MSILVPKAEVIYLEVGVSVRQAIEKIGHHHFSSVPVLSAQGHYLYSLTASDLLAFVADKGLSIKEFESVPLSEVPIYRPIQPMSMLASMEEIAAVLRDENYVPLVNDKGIFFGIITRYRFIKVLTQEKGLLPK